MRIADEQIDVIHARSFDVQFGKERKCLDYQKIRLSTPRKSYRNSEVTEKYIFSRLQTP